MANANNYQNHYIYPKITIMGLDEFAAQNKKAMQFLIEGDKHLGEMNAMLEQADKLAKRANQVKSVVAILFGLYLCTIYWWDFEFAGDTLMYIAIGASTSLMIMYYLHDYFRNKMKKIDMEFHILNNIWKNEQLEFAKEMNVPYPTPN